VFLIFWRHWLLATHLLFEEVIKVINKNSPILLKLTHYKQMFFLRNDEIIKNIKTLKKLFQIDKTAIAF